MKALFSSRERRFFLRWIRGIRAIRRRACVTTSERHIGELGVRYLSTLNRVQDSQQSLIRRDRRMQASRCMLRPSLRCGVRCMGRKKYLTLFLVAYNNVRARIGGESALLPYEFACLFGSLGDFSLPLHSQKKRTAMW